MGVQKDVVILGVFFMLSYTSGTSLSNIQTQLFEQAGISYLGELTLFLGYGFFMLWCLVAPFIGKRINYKKMLMITAVLDMLSYTSCLLLYYTDYSTLSIVMLELFNISDGFSSSLAWIAQAGYIHYACEANGVKHRKGYFFGLFFAIYGTANITSGLITTFMLGFFEIEIYFWILEGLSIFALLFCIFYVVDVQKKYAGANVPDASVLITEGETGTLAKPEKLLPAILRVFRFYPRMVPLLSSIGLVGIAMAFYSSSLHKILEMALPADA